MFRKGFAVTDSKINYLWSLRHLMIQLVRFPEGSWFGFSYEDRCEEDCCKMYVLEVVVFKITLRIEWA